MTSPGDKSGVKTTRWKVLVVVSWYGIHRLQTVDNNSLAFEDRATSVCTHAVLDVPVRWTNMQILDHPDGCDAHGFFPSKNSKNTPTHTHNAARHL